MQEKLAIPVPMVRMDRKDPAVPWVHLVHPGRLETKVRKEHRVWLAHQDQKAMTVQSALMARTDHLEKMEDQVHREPPVNLEKWGQSANRVNEVIQVHRVSVELKVILESWEHRAPMVPLAPQASLVNLANKESLANLVTLGIPVHLVTKAGRACEELKEFVDLPGLLLLAGLQKK